MSRSGSASDPGEQAVELAVEGLGRRAGEGDQQVATTAVEASLPAVGCAGADVAEQVGAGPHALAEGGAEGAPVGVGDVEGVEAGSGQRQVERGVRLARPGRRDRDAREQLAEEAASDCRCRRGRGGGTQRERSCSRAGRCPGCRPARGCDAPGSHAGSRHRRGGQRLHDAASGKRARYASSSVGGAEALCVDGEGDERPAIGHGGLDGREGLVRRGGEREVDGQPVVGQPEPEPVGIGARDSRRSTTTPPRRRSVPPPAGGRRSWPRRRRRWPRRTCTGAAAASDARRGGGRRGGPSTQSRAKCVRSDAAKRAARRPDGRPSMAALAAASWPGSDRGGRDERGDHPDGGPVAGARVVRGRDATAPVDDRRASRVAQPAHRWRCVSVRAERHAAANASGSPRRAAARTGAMASRTARALTTSVVVADG